MCVMGTASHFFTATQFLLSLNEDVAFLHLLPTVTVILSHTVELSTWDGVIKPCLHLQNSRLSVHRTTENANEVCQLTAVPLPSRSRENMVFFSCYHVVVLLLCVKSCVT